MNATAALSAAGVRRGLSVFLLGRVLSGLLGIAWLALLVRSLSTPALAAYFATLAVFEITQLASSLGVQGYVQRYMPVDLQRLARRGLARQWLLTLAWRATTLALAAVAMAALWPGLPTWTGLPLVDVPTGLFLPYLCSEGLVRHNETLLESLLQQGWRQGLMLARNALRIAGLGWFVGTGMDVDVQLLLRLELGLGGGQALLGLVVIARCIGAQPGRPADAGGRREGAGRVAFALQGYAALLLGLVAGVDTLKLVVGTVAGPAALATFGLAWAMVDMAARHLPALLLFDYARAVLTARAAQAPGSGTWFWPRLLLRLNGMALVALLAWMLSLGASAREVFAGGTQAPGLLACVATLLAMLFVQAFRLMAGLVAHLQADNRSVLWATLATWCAPPLVALSALHLGALAGACGLIAVELSYALVLKQRLRLRLSDLMGDAHFWRRVAAAGVAAAGCGLAVAAFAEPRLALQVGTLLLLGGYALLLWRLQPLQPTERMALWRLLAER